MKRFDLTQICLKLDPARAVYLMNQDQLQPFPIQQSQLGGCSDSFRKLRKNGLGLLSKQIVLQRHKAETHQRDTQPIFPGFGILIDITAGPQGCENPVDIARQEPCALRQVSDSKRITFLKLLHYAADLGHRCGHFHDTPPRVAKDSFLA